MKRRLISSLLGLALLASLGISSAAATTPGETIPGNYQCPAGALKIDPVAPGTYALPDGGTITITVRSTSAGSVFDFSASGATIDSIVVKGGPNYHVYIFTPSSGGENGLHAPKNPSNGKWYGLSHLCIEGTKKDEDPKK